MKMNKSQSWLNISLKLVRLLLLNFNNMNNMWHIREIYGIVESYIFCRITRRITRRLLLIHIWSWTISIKRDFRITTGTKSYLKTTSDSWYFECKGFLKIYFCCFTSIEQ